MQTLLRLRFFIKLKSKTIVMLFCMCQEEDEVPDDETINQMLARSEEEFDIYQVEYTAYLLLF